MFKLIIAIVLFSTSSMVFAMSISEVNSASKAQLMEINGIGDKKASAIIKERSKGKFKTFDDIQKVSGIGEKMVSNIKNDVKSKTKTTTKSTSKIDTKKERAYYQQSKYKIICEYPSHIQNLEKPILEDFKGV